MEQEKGKQKNHPLKSEDDSSPLPLVQLEAADFELMADELMAAECFELSTDFDVDVDNSSIPEELATSCGSADLRMCTVNLTSNATLCRGPEHTIRHQQRPQSIDASSSANGKDTAHQEPNTAKKPSRRKAGRYSDRLAPTQSNKKHVCNVCGAASACSQALIQHSRIHTGERPYKCGQCSAAFTQFVHLTSHSRTHTGEKPFKCDVCGAAFSHSASLTVHYRIHTGDKPFKCDVCDAAFSHSASLTVHSRTHTGEKPFKCAVCGAAFSQSSNRNTHTRKFH